MLNCISVGKQKGFTLVEVIVVSVIVAVLAAVAIPLYSAYITKTRQNAVDNTAASLAVFCGGAKNAGNSVAAVAADTTEIFDSNPVAGKRTKWTVPKGMKVKITVSPDNVTVTNVAHGETTTLDY